jgi:hypothetical protein
MDKQIIALMIPILALTIPVVATIGGYATKLAKIKADAQRGMIASPETEARIAALEDDLAHLRQELGETQERLDFTERLLAQKSEVKREP